MNVQFITSIKLLHVSAPGCHPQGVLKNPWGCHPGAKTYRSLILVMNYILLGATVCWYIDCKNMHGMNYTTLPAPPISFTLMFASSELNGVLLVCVERYPLSTYQKRDAGLDFTYLATNFEGASELQHSRVTQTWQTAFFSIGVPSRAINCCWYNKIFFSSHDLACMRKSGTQPENLHSS